MLQVAVDASQEQLSELGQSMAVLTQENETLQVAADMAENQRDLYREKCCDIESRGADNQNEIQSELSCMQDQYRMLQEQYKSIHAEMSRSDAESQERHQMEVEAWKLAEQAYESQVQTETEELENCQKLNQNLVAQLALAEEEKSTLQVGLRKKQPRANRKSGA